MTELPAANAPELIRICEQYCRERPLRPATVIGYMKLVRLFVKDTSVHRVDRVTREVLVAWRQQVAERSSKTTYNNYHRHLRALLNFCVELELIPANPILKVKPFTRVNLRKKGCTLQELQDFCGFLERDRSPLSPFVLNMVRTLFFTGMRRAQLCGLIWTDIDFGDNTIRLRKQHSKNGREWKIALHDELREIFLKMKDRARQHGDFREEDQVFMIQRHSRAYVGERMTPHQLAGIMRRFTARAGIRISPHQIRHLVATTLANKDPDDFHESGAIPASLNHIKDFLGHENISTTIGYIEPRISSQRRLIKGLELPKGNGKGG